MISLPSPNQLQTGEYILIITTVAYTITVCGLPWLLLLTKRRSYAQRALGYCTGRCQSAKCLPCDAAREGGGVGSNGEGSGSGRVRDAMDGEGGGIDGADLYVRMDRDPTYLRRTRHTRDSGDAVVVL